MDETQRLKLLKVMGIESWSARMERPGQDARFIPHPDRTVSAVSPMAVADPESLVSAMPPETSTPTPPPNAARQVESVELRPLPGPPPPQCVAMNAMPSESEPMTAEATAACWADLAREVAACTRCALHEGRTQTVFGVGDKRAGWLIVGEAPGEQEDAQGEPFVGRAGQLLNEMIRALGLDRQRVYIANILKCRPPANRDPSADESKACEDYLKRQIELVKPQIILAVGRVAAQNLLKTTATIGSLRGRIHDYHNTPLIVTYHPAYLLRAPLEKRRAWDDLKLAIRHFEANGQAST